MKKKKCFFLCGTFLLVVLVLCIVLLINHINSNTRNSQMIEKVNNADKIVVVIPRESEPINSSESEELADFYNIIVSCFNENDIERFNSLLLNKEMRWVNFNVNTGLCISSYMYSSKQSNSTFIKNGKLLEQSTETDPPINELGLSAAMFGGNTALLRDRVSKEGIIEHIDWSIADVDYINEHYDAIYNELTWLIEMPSDSDSELTESVWANYKLSNDTFLLSDGMSWYSDKIQNRTMLGYVFVFKRISGELKIVAFIAAK